MVQDSNASCLDVALEALQAFAESYVNASDHSAELAPGIVAKGLSGRPGTITRAEETLLKLMEVRLYFADPGRLAMRYNAVSNVWLQHTCSPS